MVISLTQGQYAAALAAGKFALPSQDVMLRSWLDRVHAQKDFRIVDVNVVGTEMVWQKLWNM